MTKIIIDSSITLTSSVPWNQFVNQFAVTSCIRVNGHSSNDVTVGLGAFRYFNAVTIWQEQWCVVIYIHNKQTYLKDRPEREEWGRLSGTSQKRHIKWPNLLCHKAFCYCCCCCYVVRHISRASWIYRQVDNYKVHYAYFKASFLPKNKPTIQFHTNVDETHRQTDRQTDRTLRLKKDTTLW